MFAAAFGKLLWYIRKQKVWHADVVFYTMCVLTSYVRIISDCLEIDTTERSCRRMDHWLL
jgi:hypothetical protein